MDFSGTHVAAPARWSPLAPDAGRSLDRSGGEISAPGAVGKSNDRRFASVEFIPMAPTSFADAGLADQQIEALILRFLCSSCTATGRKIADQVKLPFPLIEKLLRQMKADQLIGYKGSAPFNDYAYQLAPLGAERSAIYAEHSTYFGSAPVSLEEYAAGVTAQSPRRQLPTAGELRVAFADMVVSPTIFSQLGQAAHSGGAMFLYGSPGNGKTSIAERFTKAFGPYIWIPRALNIEGEIVRLFDPSLHKEAPASEETPRTREIDMRWVRIERPTVITGGELEMENLEIAATSARGIYEAPFQLKASCGTLVIDDFGRQRISTRELLNRWIIPLEKGYDFLNLPNGKKIRVPFDQLVIFATNLEPKDLMDEAFLRRIGYKIYVPDPTEEQFRHLFQLLSPKMGLIHSEPAVSHLIEKHYKSAKREFRNCHVRDLLLQIRNYCAFHECALEMRSEYFDAAVLNYFPLT